MFWTKRIFITQFPILSLFFLVSLFWSCKNNSSNLSRIKDLGVANPELALDSITHINRDLYQTDRDKIEYLLVLYDLYDRTEKRLDDIVSLDWAIEYCKKENKEDDLALLYFYKGQLLRSLQKFAAAYGYYLKSYDLIKDSDNNYLKGRIKLDLSLINLIRLEHKHALEMANEALFFFRKDGNLHYTRLAEINISRYFRLRRKNCVAISMDKKMLSTPSDSVVTGLLLQELGLAYYNLHQFDSSANYFLKSFRYPSKGVNASIRYVSYAELLFDKAEYDSAQYYSHLSAHLPASYYIRRDASRIIANCAYLKKDFKKMNLYIKYYQDYTDSIQMIDLQEKPSSIETVFSKTKDSDHSHKMLVIVILGVVLVMSGGVVLVYKSYRKRKEEASIIDQYKKQITQKSELLIQGLDKKLEIARKQQSSARKKSTSEQRAALDKELYQKALNLDNWDAFSCEMNHAFNNIVSDLENNFSGISQKEIIWCCLDLLNVPVVDRLSVLEATTDSMYKLKQRLAVKLNAKSAKDVDLFLKNYKNADQVG